MSDNSDARANQADAQGQKKGGGIGVIVVILIVIIGVIVFFATQKTGPELGKVMEILPHDCAMLMQMDLDKADDPNLRDELWTKLKENPEFKKSLKDLEGKENIDLEEDIMSWMGNQVTVTFVEMPGDMKPGDKPSADAMAMAFTVKDLDKAKAKVKELSGENSKTEKYGDTDMIISADDESVMAFVKGMFVVSGSVDTMKQVIDTAGGKGKALKDNKEVALALTKLPPKSVGLFYMDFAPIMEAAMEGMGQGPENEMAEEFLKAMKYMAMGFGIEKENIVASGFVAIDKNSNSVIVKSMMQTKANLGDPKSLKLYPSDVSYYGAIDIKYIYEIVMKIVETQEGGIDQVNTAMEQFKEQTGVDLQKDIIDNLSGELAYTMDFAELMQSQMRGRGSSQEPPPVVLSLLVKDKAKMQEVMDKLTGTFGEMFLTKRDKDGITVYDLPENSGSFVLYEDFFILGIGKGSAKLNTLMDNKMDEAKSLASREGYKLIKPKINNNTISVAMMQFEKILPMLEMAKAMGASQDPKSAAAMNTMIEYIKKYGELWSTSEVTSDGFKFDMIILKTAK